MAYAFPKGSGLSTFPALTATQAAYTAGRSGHSVLLYYVKISNLSLSLAATLGLTAALLAGCASQSDTREAQSRQLTGSYIPQNVQQKGPITNGANDVRVRDESDLQRSGGATPGQALRQLGEVH